MTKLKKYMMKPGQSLRYTLYGIAWIWMMMMPTLTHASRIKDIVHVNNVRDNMLVGYGLIVGLQGTGDSQNMRFTQVSLKSMLERLGVKSSNITSDSKSETLATKNVAAVVVTAVLPPFARQGSRIDVSVSSLGDAKSLLGGTLLVTPLYGADGSVYAVGQGPVAASGYSANANAGTNNSEAVSKTRVSKGVPTSGRVANGAIIEKEIGYELAEQNTFQLSLRNPDFTTAKRVADAINNAKLHPIPIAQALDPSTIQLDVPLPYQKNIVSFIHEIEHIRIEPDHVARVVIHDSEGVVVMSDNVRIQPVAITHGSLNIRITEKHSQSAQTTTAGDNKNPYSTRADTFDAESNVQVQEEKTQMTVIESGVTLQDLVKALNTLGTTPRDLISILQTIKAAGALQADVEVM